MMGLEIEFVSSFFISPIGLQNVPICYGKKRLVAIHSIFPRAKDLSNILRRSQMLQTRGAR